MSSDEDDALAACAVAIAIAKTHWQDGRPWLKTKSCPRRLSYYFHGSILKELRTTPRDWYKILRMDEVTYLKLLNILTPFIRRKNTIMRLALSPHERLAATLGYLATGRSFSEMQRASSLSMSTLSSLIPETCSAICEVLGKDHIKFPETQNDWLETAGDFERAFQFPNCLGALGGKQVDVIAPVLNRFHHHSSNCSLVLVVLANAKYEFMQCETTLSEELPCDGRAIYKTEFFERLLSERLQLPPARPTLGSDRPLPFVFVSEDAFPMEPDLLRCYENAGTTEQKIFNFRLSRARRAVDSALGIMSTRFGVFNSQMKLKLPSVELVVKACCALHNFLMQSSAGYASEQCFDHEDLDAGSITRGYRASDSLMLDLSKAEGECPADISIIRDEFADYFVSEGELPWQERFVQ